MFHAERKAAKRAVVFGYGELGVTALETLSELDLSIVAAVAPSNRMGVDVERFRARAGDFCLPLLVQPRRKVVAPFQDALASLDPDVFLVWSYSMILPPSLIAIPRTACLNVHGGLLPQYRGPHVLQWAIIHGEPETGVTLHHVDAGIDTGPVIATVRFPILDSDDAATVRDRLRDAGRRVLREWLPRVLDGETLGVPQDESLAVYHRARTAADGVIDWRQPAERIRNLVRALVRPWPGAFAFRGRDRLTVWRAELAGSQPEGVTPGTVIDSLGLGPVVATADGGLLLRGLELTFPNASRKSATEAQILRVGEVLTGSPAERTEVERAARA